MVVMETKLHIRAQPWRYVVVGKRVDVIALVGTLIVVIRREIQLVAGGKRPHPAHAVGDGERAWCSIGAKVDELAGSARPRAGAGKPVGVRAGCAGAVIAIGLQYRV